MSLQRDGSEILTIPHVCNDQNTREVAAAIRGKNLKKAQKYLKHVLAHKDAIPYTRHCGNIGRHAQGHKFKINSGGQCRWPEKPVRHILDLLQNAESNAEVSCASF